MIITTNRIIPERFDALTVFPFILVRPQWRDDVGLIEHERTHLRDQLRWGVIPWAVLYLCSRRFRLRAEVLAYRRQMEVGGITLYQAAEHLLKYDLGITYLQAVAALKGDE